MSSRQTKLKRADLLSSVGAGVLGAGLALLLADRLRPYAVPLLALGVVSHASGMFAKHRLDAPGDAPRVRWAEWLYWGCWIGLAVLGVWIGIQLR